MPVESPKSKVSDIELKKLTVFARGSSQLSSLEFEKEIPWPIRRVFFIASHGAQDRGDHAHKECIQAIICSAGKVHIHCFDGEKEKSFQLCNLGELLLVPAGIWLKINFQPESSITVLASQEFLESDYIRSWNEYMKYRLSE